MREPSARAFSEWAMFALQWAWDPISEFEPSLAMRANQLRTCNASLFRNVSLLRSLPTPELSAYLAKCWNYGGAMMYAQTSMYSVCILHALRYFRREQFLFLRYVAGLATICLYTIWVWVYRASVTIRLASPASLLSLACVLRALPPYLPPYRLTCRRYEDMMAMDAASLLKLIGRFAGLYAGDDLVYPSKGRNGRPMPDGLCQPRSGHGSGSGHKPAATYMALSPEEKVLYNASAAQLERERPSFDALFAPYSALLTELVGHPDFGW